EVSDEGFRAEWTLSAFGRQLPLATPAVSLRNLSRSSFWSSEVGVRLYEPASLYQQVERSVKYGVLLIALTFVGLLLIEFAGGVRIHLMQYGLVGLSLCVFYLLYLSLSEHIGLVLAYAAGALAVVGQVGLFLRGILGRWRPAVVLAALLCGLYAGFYLLLGSADYALLIGSLALFFGLGAVMYATRKIDWSGLSTPAPTKAGQSPAG
ncbi:MAG: inner membrane CreD family protein, partial [Pseudomonadota bacterium]